MTSHVYVVSLNDMILGIFSSIKKAEKRIEEYKHVNRDVEWKKFERSDKTRGPRWYAEGGISRLEWEEYYVR